MFITELFFKKILGEVKKVELTQDLVWEDDVYHIRCKAGLESDGASVPQIFWTLFPPFAGKYLEAAVLHDGLYMSEAFERDVCDTYFLTAMKQLGVSAWKRYTMFYAVRGFGWTVWNRHTRSSVEAARKLVDITPKVMI